MVRFSCFNSHTHSSKPKKIVSSAESMHKALEDPSDKKGLKDFTNSSAGSPLHLKLQKDACLTADQVTTSSSAEHECRSEDIKCKYNAESDTEIQKTHMKKCQSLGSGLDHIGRVFTGNDSRDGTDQGFSGDGSHGQCDSVISVGEKEPEVNRSNNCPRALRSVSVQVSSDMVNNESIFSIGDAQQSEKGDCHENSDTHCSGECSSHTPQTPHMRHAISKSCSMPNIVSSCGHSTTVTIMPRATSCEDLNVLLLNRKEVVVPDVGSHLHQDDEGHEVRSNEKNIDNLADDNYEGYNYVGTAKDWIIPAMDEVNTSKIPRPDSATSRLEDLPGKDFKIKRIEEWVMDLQHCSPSDETQELSTSTDHLADARVTVLDRVPAAKQDGKTTPGMEAAKRYISSLSATATSAQLANLGLVVIPFLSAFVSLKALNLSGNAIVRITAGALPRGLHVLNLSKNSIATIEGLRELTRLRVLDLSYNRILRIGHGLASCSSLKELYLAGNKISEVEGLHRLLKLNVLDLRFNKISTTKCLGQLAANYNSLQAISLEGNPAQKNVGDEQLKKYLQGLLPQLIYFNRQSIKAGTLKDPADRSARLGISAHQKSDLKTVRKGNHGAAALKRPSPSTSVHGRRSQAPVAAPKPSRDRHGQRLPPSGMKTSVRGSFYDFGSKLLNFRADLALQRSRSEGTLGAL